MSDDLLNFRKEIKTVFNGYPYTDMHELNLDWCIAKLKELNQRVDEITDEIAAEVYEKAVEYIDENLAGVIQEFNDLKIYVDDELRDMNDTIDGLNQQFLDLAGDFDDLVAEVERKILQIQNYIDGQIAGVNLRTDSAIAANNNYILGQLSQFLADIKVVNFFTGEEISIQDMFDYLAMLHVSDGIDYATLASRNKTYADIAALNITYTDVVLHGNTLIV